MMTRKNLKTHWEPQGFEEYRYFRQSWMAVVGLGFCALKGCVRVNLKIPCGSSSKVDLKKAYVFSAALVVFMQMMMQN